MRLIATGGPTASCYLGCSLLLGCVSTAKTIYSTATGDVRPFTAMNKGPRARRLKLRGFVARL